MTSTIATLLISVLAQSAPSAAPPDTSGQVPKAATAEQRVADLTALSLDELVKVRVTTASRRSEPWWLVPSGLDVVTGEDIRLAGAENLPDALRLATGVHVGQPSARSWAISIRGMNVLAANKISVAMDGRSLFTPFFSGVQWDAQDTFLEDIDRIEVVRGPVGALWGAFAVNGFIQVLTKPASESQGLLATAGTGTEEPMRLGLRYGGRLGDKTAYRAYAKYVQSDWTYLPFGPHAQGATDFVQAGFRLDRGHADETSTTLQGDYYTNQDLPLDRLQVQIYGGNVLGRWRRVFSPESELQAEGYLDHTYREIPAVFEETRTTAATSLKYRRTMGRHVLLFGADALVSGDEIGNMGVAQLLPGERTIHTVGFFVQDAVRLTSTLAAVGGVKAEQSSFAGLEWQPTARLTWTPSPRTTAWGAISRGVRTPVRVDEDLVLRTGGLTLFEANDDFATETAVAYELGLRHRPFSAMTIMASAFSYEYDHLRSTEPAGDLPLPLTFLNTLNASSRGAEIAVQLQPVSHVHVKGSYRYLDLDFSTDPGSRHTTGGRAEGNDPRHVATIAGHVFLPARVVLSAIVRGVSALPDPALGGYTTLDLRLGWRPVPRLELSISGRDLIDRQHAEFVTTNSLNEEVRRRAFVKLTWRPAPASR